MVFAGMARSLGWTKEDWTACASNKKGAEQGNILNWSQVNLFLLRFHKTEENEVLEVTLPKVMSSKSISKSISHIQFEIL